MSRRGFTLLELLIVIAVIGILMGMLLPAIVGAQEAARGAGCQSNLKQIGTACYNFHSVFGYFQSDNAASALPYPYPNTCWNLQTLNYMEQADAVQAVSTVPSTSASQQQSGNAAGSGSLVPVNNGNVLLTSYLCPSRGIRGNGLTDYGYVQQDYAVLYGGTVRCLFWPTSVEEKEPPKRSWWLISDVTRRTMAQALRLGTTACNRSPRKACPTIKFPKGVLPTQREDI